MSEDEGRNVTQHDDERDEVEAHHHTVRANDEADTEGDDDFEAHRSHLRDKPASTN
jgi:hypothetical protein